jgi:hypothetical protein
MHHHELVDQVHRLLMDNLPLQNGKTPGGWTTFNCPMCSDRRKRAGVIQSGSKISFHCFNCQYTTGWAPAPRLGGKYKKLVETLGVQVTDIHKVVLDLMKFGEELEIEDTDDSYVYSAAEFKTHSLPDETTMVEDLPDDHKVKQYAIERGLLGKFPLLHINNPVYSARLTIPFMYNNKLVGWTGRHVNPPNKETAKYLLNTQPGYVFNIDRFVDSDRDFVIVVEGVFDAVFVDGISVLGNVVTPEQAHLIDKLNKRVILCPDRDEPGKELIDQAVDLGWEVSFPPWHPDIKDAADAIERYGRLLTVKSIVDFATNNKVKIRVQSKML